MLPDIGAAVLAQTFVIETIPNIAHSNDAFNETSVPLRDQQAEKQNIHLCDLSAFVVATENCNSVLVAHFEGHQEGHGLHRVVAAVHIISHEQIISVRRLAYKAFVENSTYLPCGCTRKQTIRRHVQARYNKKLATSNSK